MGNPPSVEYGTSPARTYGGFWDDVDDDRRGSRRDGRSRAKASPRGGRRGRAQKTPRSQAPRGQAPRTQVAVRSQVAVRAQSSQRRSPRRRRRNVVVPVAVVASIAVAAASVTAYVRGHHHATGGNAAFEAIQNSNTLPLLAAERQQLVDMNAATQVLAIAGKPLMVSPSQVQSSASGSSSTSGGTIIWPTPNPAAAQATAKAMLASYGWNTSSQWSCLLSLWNRESGWVYDAENTASGAYGIPQSLPASKMASAGADYLTNPTTQIKWGLGYIQGRYGNPCGAWNFELANGFY